MTSGMRSTGLRPQKSSPRFGTFCVYIAVGATAFFFQRASQNINTSGEESSSSRAVVGVADVRVPLVNVLAIPTLWARTYYHSLSFLPEFRLTRVHAAAVGISAFTLLISGHAVGPISDNLALWPKGYDAMSLTQLMVDEVTRHERVRVEGAMSTRSYCRI